MKKHPRRHGDRLRQFEELCREKGVPLTVQRRVILEAVLGRGDHPTAEQIYGDVADRLPGLSRATVYRVLDTLVGLGVISKAAHLGAAVRFDASVDRHHHLVCVRCEKVIDVDDRRLDALPVPDTREEGFEISGYSVQFTGVCADCRKRPPEGRASAITRRRRKRAEDKGSGREGGRPADVV